VWERAAELQIRPDAPAKPRTSADHRAPSSQSSAYSVDVVRDSAREAGIGTGYVDRALIEHGLANAPVAAGEEARGRRDLAARETPTALVRDVAIDDRSPWTGERSNIDYEVVVDDEMHERDFDWIVESIRRTLGDVGVISTVGRSLSWVSSDPQRKVQVSVQIRGGRTTIRVGERLAMLRGSVFGGIMGGFGGGFGGGALGLVMGTTHVAPLALAVASTIVGGSYVAARATYRRSVRKRALTLRSLAEELGEEVRISIYERTRKDAPSRPGSLPRR
jgi:hypothetical protein